jgi:large subunit ribosomal protein L22
MKVEARLKNLRITPRKVRLVAYSIKGSSVEEALVQLEKQIKRSALPLMKLLKSAVANAENNFGLSREDLYVADVTVGDGPRLKRWMPRAHGRATMILKRMSQVRLILEERAGTKRKKAVKKSAPQPAEAEVISEKRQEQKEGSAKTATKRLVRTDKKTAGRLSPKKGPAVTGKKVFQRKSA